MYYPIAIEQGSDSAAYGVIVPDLKGCFSAGDTLEEALLQAEDAVLLHLEDYLEQGMSFPKSTALESLQALPEYQGFMWSVVRVDLSKLADKSTRVNISLPEKVLHLIDKAAHRAGESRSGFIAKAALSYIQEQRAS